MGDTARTRRIEVAPGDFVELVELEHHRYRKAVVDVVGFLEGDTDWFAQFDVPRYVDDGDCEDSSDPVSCPEEIRLIAFANLVRPIPWPDDPRLPEFRDLITRLQLGHAEVELQDAPTQFLWDALFAHVQADRFMEGLIASHAYGMTLVANEIRRRLLARE